ncbi:hypothetical protein B0J15DRAFT_400868 [Fusarium solani]|uniref:F-box domain-containing protein n=1 Tax=Fusarium solani TaxID=169388 RepID=A0A9P9H1U4_FUSSL|nr:uncharacterized protein B0J15DRAFT_400868 [Fusarium solani]KAH7248332.1 hypothetical protein B0J15DRAFT_400868 [Fusarium solani]
MIETPTGLFELLPNETILHLAGLLPIADVVSLKRATHDLLPVLAERIDPSRYLQSTGPFADSPELLEVMARHGAVLSGSRALEYFVPGSSTNDSDWDFYVPPILPSIIAVKKALEKSGVTFESSLESAARKLREKSGVILSQNQIVSIAYEAFFNKSSWSMEQKIVINSVRYMYPALRDMTMHVRENGSVGWMGDLIPIFIREGGRVTFLQPHEEITHGYPENVASKVLSGTAHRNGSAVSVQLVVGTIDRRMTSITNGLSQTVFGSILSFYGSHVQCMLSKHIALHLYYRLASGKSAFRWQVPEAVHRRAEDAVEKYVTRGFRFITASDNGGEWTFRSAQDNDSYLIEFDTREHYVPTLSQIKDLRWCHMGEMIQMSSQPKTIDSRHELLRFGIVSR